MLGMVGENVSHQHFLFFPQCFLTDVDTFYGCIKPPFFTEHVSMISILVFDTHFLKNDTKHLKMIQNTLISVNPFPNKPWFLHVCSTNVLKTLWEKVKLLVTSNFTFFHSVLCPFGELFAIFIKLKMVVCKLFQFGRV